MTYIAFCLCFVETLLFFRSCTALRLDSQLRKAHLTYEWNVSLRSYVSICIHSKKIGAIPEVKLKASLSKWMFTNQSYYKAGNLETVHFLTKLSILLKSTFCLFFLISDIGNIYRILEYLSDIGKRYQTSEIDIGHIGVILSQ